MKKIALVCTCYNRKNKTIRAFQQLHACVEKENFDIVDYYLTDDGSTDGTSEEIVKHIPEINIFKGSGDLFWAGGMGVAFEKALEKEYDGYILFNDDVDFYDNSIKQLLECDIYCNQKYGQGGLYVGTTVDPVSKSITYGGNKLQSSIRLVYEKVVPKQGEYKEVDLTNFNMVLISKNVANRLGNLSKEYTHGLADFDYSLRAKKAGLPVLLASGSIGECVFDHKPYQPLCFDPFEIRIKRLNSPKEGHKNYLLFTYKFFPLMGSLMWLHIMSQVYAPFLSKLFYRIKKVMHK